MISIEAKRELTPPEVMFKTKRYLIEKGLFKRWESVPEKCTLKLISISKDEETKGQVLREVLLTINLSGEYPVFEEPQCELATVESLKIIFQLYDNNVTLFNQQP